MPIHLPHYPPFGFSVWYDRHRGRRWCWRERHPAPEILSAAERGIVAVEGDSFASKKKAVMAVREELARRKAQAQPPEPE